MEAAKANNEANFSAYFGRILDDLFIQRMEGNDEIFHRVMSDKQFRATAQDHLAREVYERVRGSRGLETTGHWYPSLPKERLSEEHQVPIGCG